MDHSGTACAERQREGTSASCRRSRRYESYLPRSAPAAGQGCTLVPGRSTSQSSATAITVRPAMHPSPRDPRDPRASAMRRNIAGMRAVKRTLASPALPVSQLVCSTSQCSSRDSFVWDRASAVTGQAQCDINSQPSGHTVSEKLLHSRTCSQRGAARDSAFIHGLFDPLDRTAVAGYVRQRGVSPDKQSSLSFDTG